MCFSRNLEEKTAYFEYGIFYNSNFYAASNFVEQSGIAETIRTT